MWLLFWGVLGAWLGMGADMFFLGGGVLTIDIILCEYYRINCMYCTYCITVFNLITVYIVLIVRIYVLYYISCMTRIYYCYFSKHSTYTYIHGDIPLNSS